MFPQDSIHENLGIRLFIELFLEENTNLRRFCKQYFGHCHEIQQHTEALES